MSVFDDNSITLLKLEAVCAIFTNEDGCFKDGLSVSKNELNGFNFLLYDIIKQLWNQHREMLKIYKKERTA